MKGDLAGDTRARLSDALAGSGETERGIADLELPRALGWFTRAQRVAKLRPAAVLIAIVHEAGEARVLLTQRRRDLRKHGGQISLPGGAQDGEDDDIKTTALRESHEEVGLPAARVEVLGYLADYPTSSGFRVTPVVGWVEGGFVPRIAETEVAEAFYVPLAVLLDASAYSRKSFLRDGIRLPFFQLDWEGRHIWGATAGMLRELALRVAEHG